MRSALLCDITQRIVVITYRRFRTNYLSNIQGSRNPRRKLSSWIPWPLRMGRIRCPETSVRNYHDTLHDVTEDRRSHSWVIYSVPILNGYNLHSSPFLYISLIQSRTHTLPLLFIGFIQHALKCRSHVVVLRATLPHQHCRISRLQTRWREI